MSFSPEELDHYSRHLLVRDFGGLGQSKLKSSHICVIGAGGIGAPALLYLAASGVGQITIFEDDVVAASNLQRQILYNHEEIGAAKVEVAIQKLRALNPFIEINPLGRFAGELPNCDLVLDASDRLSTRQAANQAAKAACAPLLSASIGQWEGQIAHFDPAHMRGCYHCLYADNTDESAIPNCAEAGVIGAMAGVIGTMAALEAVKILSETRPLPAATMLLVDGAYREMREIKITPREGCPICG